MGNYDGASWFPVWNLWESTANLITIFPQAKGLCKHWCFLKVTFSCIYLLGRSWMSDTCFTGWCSVLLFWNPSYNGESSQHWSWASNSCSYFVFILIRSKHPHTTEYPCSSGLWGLIASNQSIFLTVLCPPQTFHQQYRHRRQNETNPFLVRIF